MGACGLLVYKFKLLMVGFHTSELMQVHEGLNTLLVTIRDYLKELMLIPCK
jgi:hypothetical protein